jgi:hypothetical protein
LFNFFLNLKFDLKKLTVKVLLQLGSGAIKNAVSGSGMNQSGSTTMEYTIGVVDFWIFFGFSISFSLQLMGKIILRLK